MLRIILFKIREVIVAEIFPAVLHSSKSMYLMNQTWLPASAAKVAKQMKHLNI